MKDISNQKFHSLTPIKTIGVDRRGNKVWLCLCDCGIYRSVSGNRVIRGEAKRCGRNCKQKVNKQKVNNHTGGVVMSKTKFYSSWHHMKQRCLNKNTWDYRWYGGKGVTVCERWIKFKGFREDMFESYLSHTLKHGKDTTIDRINPNGNYELSNCRWATMGEQQHNKVKTLKGRDLRER